MYFLNLGAKGIKWIREYENNWQISYCELSVAVGQLRLNEYQIRSASLICIGSL